MSTVAAAVEALDGVRVVEICEDTELTAAEKNDVHPFPAFHLLGLLLLEDLSEARFLWKRLPPLCQEHPETKAAWKLAQALWKRDNFEFFQAAESAHWSHEAAHLVKELVRRKREAAKLLVERSYSCISLQRASALLGLDQPALLQLCQAEDWVVDGDFILITTVKNNRKIPDHAAVQQRELQVLTEQLIKLQTTS